MKPLGPQQALALGLCRGIFQATRYREFLKVHNVVHPASDEGDYADHFFVVLVSGQRLKVQVTEVE